MDLIQVVNKHHLKVPNPETDIYVGRGSPLGNPHKIGPGMSRHTAINCYKGWLHQRILAGELKVCEALNEIADRVMDNRPTRLVCFCVPQDCHAFEIKRVVMAAIAKEQTS